MTIRNIRRGLVALVVVAAMGSAAPALAEADGKGPFVDTDGSAHESDVAALWHADLTSGCGVWRFCPDDPVSRGEMAAFLARALELPRPSGVTFLDTAKSPFAADIEAVAVAGITRGCGERLYCPEDPVTRAQMASFLSRALELSAAERDVFVDDDASVHEADIDRLAGADITRGCGDDVFCPTHEVTRAEVASFLARGLGLEQPSELPAIPADVIDSFLETAGVAWPTGPGAEGWRPLVAEYFEADDVDRAVRIMSCESKGDPGAHNGSSGASGLFQHMPAYWHERSSMAGWGGASIFDPEANVAVAAWLVYDYAGGGWHHWVCD
jgi:hypothetical protein